MFMKAEDAELDDMMGISANVMCGQLGSFRTNAFDVLVDDDKYMKEAQNIAVDRG